MPGASPKARRGPRCFSRPRLPAGFTLVEVMIVVAIIGTLAAIAVPTFMRMRERARVAEAKANLGAIRAVEYGFYAEYNRYVGNQPFTPDRTLTPAAKLDWDPTTRFSILGFAPEGRVYFSYAIGGVDYNLDFTAQARSDLDDDGEWALWETTSANTEITRVSGQL